jgi:isopentenyl phosphate kinase
MMTEHVETAPLTFVKLGGSLITNKGEAYAARPAVIARLADEVRAALDAEPKLTLLLGHGSGSYGHWAAEPYGTAAGVETRAEWRGYAEVAAAAARLNRLVTDELLEAGVATLSLQPSASAVCRDGAVAQLSVRPIREALEHGLVPLVYGDVALDEVRGGTIASTEDLFVYLAGELRPSRILLLSRVPGVLDRDDEVIPVITPDSYARWRHALSGSEAVDVTGGMLDKVEQMVDLVSRQPRVRVRIMSGQVPGLLTRVLLGESIGAGTLITA